MGMVDVMVVSNKLFYDIWVCNYEVDLSVCCILFGDVFGFVGVVYVIVEVIVIDVDGCCVIMLIGVLYSYD